MDIRRDISEKRRIRIKSEGYGLSTVIPKKRTTAINDFSKGPFVICEIKRGSPSKGHFAHGLNAVEQAEIYQKSGVNHISVLTEEDHFFGSLQDIVDIKKKCPTMSILRKDFLLDERDVEVSYLCGADAILLIASLLNRDTLTSMYRLSLDLGLTPLIEVHSRDDVSKLMGIKPQLVGINSRDLKNFMIDPLRPLKIRSFIDWDCDVIYESGIKSGYDAQFARDTGFSGVLVGEWAVRDQALAHELVLVFQKERKALPWELLFKRYSEHRPFIKICGLTNRRDVELAKELGANMVGFVLAPSPRQVDNAFIRSLNDIDGIIKVGVVVLERGEKLSDDIKGLIEGGFLDLIQFHGDESYITCLESEVPFYKGVRVKDERSIKSIAQYGAVALIDSFSYKERGGTGTVINYKYTALARERANLWLAGGVNPENVRRIVAEFSPELIDVSSGLESKPGIKDETKMRAFFKELI